MSNGNEDDVEHTNLSPPNRVTNFSSAWIRYTCIVIISISIYSLILVYVYNALYVQTHLSSTSFRSSCVDKEKNLPTARDRDFSRNAFVSIFSNGTDLLQTLVLGYSIRQHHSKHPMILLHSEHELRNQTVRCALETIGWTLISVPRTSSVVPSQLLLWNMTQYDSVIYLPNNSMVLSDLSHLHELVVEPDRTGFTLARTDPAHAGVLVLHPCQQRFNELRRRHLLGYAHGNRSDSAASLHVQYLQLPVAYSLSVNLAPTLWPAQHADWKIIQGDLQDVLSPNIQQHQQIFDRVRRLYSDFQTEKDRFGVCKLLSL